MKIDRRRLRKLILKEMSKFGRGDLPKRPPQPSFRYDGPEDFPEGNFLGNQDRDIDSGMIDAAINLLIPLSYDYKNAGIALKALRALRSELRQEM